MIASSVCILSLILKNDDRQKWKFRQKNFMNSETEEEEEGRDSVATNRYVKEMRKKLSSDDEMN